MDPLMHIQENLKLLTKQEERVAKYVIEHPSDVVHMNAQEIGDITHTSSATVIRFIKKMSYNGLSDFKVTISRYLPDEQMKVYKQIERDETVDSITTKLLARAQYSMEMTTERIDSQKIDEVATMISQVSSIIVYGIGASDIVAQDIYQKFLRAGLNVICSKDAHLIAATLAAQKGKALFIGISSSGENKAISKMFKVATDYQVSRVALTSNANAAFIRDCDYVLLHDASTEESLRLAATSSLLSQLLVVDILFYTYLVKHFDSQKVVIDDTRQAVKVYEEL